MILFPSIGNPFGEKEGSLVGWKSHATLTLLAKQDCPLWLQYD